MAWPTPPGPLPAPGYEGYGPGDLALTGLGSLMQGYAQGSSLAMQRDMELARIQESENYRNAMLGIRGKAADALAAKNAPASPIPAPAGTEWVPGKGFIRTPPATTATAKTDPVAGALAALDIAQKQRDALGYADTTLGSQLPGVKNVVFSHIPGTPQNLFRDSTIPATMAALKGVAGSIRNWSEIQAAMQTMGDMAGTKSFNDQQFDTWRNIIKAANHTAGATPIPQGVGTVPIPQGNQNPLYSTPQAAQIRAAYQAGQLTREQASQQLDALGQGNGS